MEAVVASEAAKQGEYYLSNMHMDKYVNEITDFKSEVRFDLQGCLEAVVASEAAKRAHTI